jgi:hypothetical protein
MTINKFYIREFTDDIVIINRFSDNNAFIAEFNLPMNMFNKKDIEIGKRVYFNNIEVKDEEQNEGSRHPVKRQKH